MDNHFQKFITGLQHIGIPANDLEATIAFYDTLGFQVAFRTVNEAANEKVAFLRMGDVTIETYENKHAALAKYCPKKFSTQNNPVTLTTLIYQYTKNDNSTHRQF